MDDFDLLQAYASERAEDAFATLTARYLNLVHSAALRQMGDAHAAEDVTQAVFLTLARKAGVIRRDAVLSAWLLRTTRFAAANARRLQQRRQFYEQQAMHSDPSFSESESAWPHIAPLLDEALDHLGAKDRNAVVLRFFEHRSLKEIGTRLGMSEDTAQKRVARAIEKLRVFFGRWGRHVSVSVLTTVIAAKSVEAAPTNLITAVGAAVASEGVMTGTAIGLLARATAGTLARARLRLLATRIGGVGLAAGLVVVTAFEYDRTAATETALRSAPALAPSAPPLHEQVRERRAMRAPRTRGRQIAFQVLNAKSDAPISGARLTLRSIVDPAQATTNTFITDERGNGVVGYVPAKGQSWDHRIEVFHDGYVPKFVSWSSYQEDRPEEMPAAYSLKLDPAVTIGGFVEDEQNRPIADVRVVFSVSGPSVGASRARERLTMMGDYHTETTDAEGRWSCNHVPARFGMIDFTLVHPQFQEKTYQSDSVDSPNGINLQRIAEADLLARTAVMRIKPGLGIAGIVIDENSQPVAGAKVTQDFEFNHPERNLMTGADGLFRFGNGRPSDLWLTIQAEGFAPIVTSIVAKASVENLKVVLSPGRLLRGRVVDEANEPIPGASIEAASPSADSRMLFEWRTKTDGDGFFGWDAAPARQEYAIEASGFGEQLHVSLTADGTEQLIQLKRQNTASIRITGRVLDQETKRPPSAARVQIWETRNEPEAGGWSTFTTRPEDTTPDGEFRFRTSPETLSYVLEGQADGYWPERVTNQVTGAGEIQINLELRKAPLSAGIVLTPSGDPAGGATLAICGQSEWAAMTEPGKLQIGAHSSMPGVSADSAGRFQLPARNAPELVVIAHPAGFLEVPFVDVGSNTVLRLKPWGRIEGVANLGSKPLVDEMIVINRLSAYLGPRVALHFRVRTDSEGRFAFETVPPGEWIVAREINDTPLAPGALRIAAYSHAIPLAVEPGNVTRITVGGGGRPVTGRALPPEAIQSIPWIENSAELVLKVPAPEAPERPLREKFQSDGEFTAALKVFYTQSETYWGSDRGLAIRRLQREYRAMFAPDGTFRIEDVPPGDYTLKIALAEPPRRSSSKVTELARLEMDVTVPSIAADEGATTVDLGQLQLHPAPQQTVKK